MSSRCVWRSFAACAVFVFLFVPALTGQIMRVGQNDEVTLETPVRIGQAVLQPGTYRFEHVIETDHHVIALKPISSGSTRQGVRVKCSLESVGAPAKYTELHFAPGKTIKTLHYILVAGESDRHMF